MLLLNNENLLIGHNPITGAAFDGMIDELRLYNRPLSAAEVLSLAPEPASMTLVLVPTGLFVARRWRKRRVLSKDGTCSLGGAC